MCIRECLRSLHQLGDTPVDVAHQICDYGPRLLQLLAARRNCSGNLLVFQFSPQLLYLAVAADDLSLEADVVTLKVAFDGAEGAVLLCYESHLDPNALQLLLKIYGH